MAVIDRVVLRRLRLPLERPYRLSYRIFHDFEPFLVEVWDRDGRTGFADAHVSPGSSSETREGAWMFCLTHIPELLGAESAAAKEAVLARFEESKVAATALVCAVEVLEGNGLLAVEAPSELPLVTPVNALEPAEIEDEIEGRLAEGFTTFKVKVGKDVSGDLARVAAIQVAAAGRATLRLDANRAFTREDGIAFAERLDPANIELFEQPCDSDDWDANAAVAAASNVPLMLDEPICTLADIDRAAGIPGVGYCKLKLKRFGGLDRLRAGLEAVCARGMVPVLGDGLGSDVHGWLEASVGRTTIDNAGEFNGFLKTHDRLLAPSLPFGAGAVRLPAGYRPELDRQTVGRLTVDVQEFRAG